MQWNRRQLLTSPLNFNKYFNALVALSLTLLYSPTLFAQQPSAHVDIQNFRPGAGPHQIFSVETADVLDHMTPTGLLVMDYLSEPLILRFEDDSTEPVIERQLAAHLVMGMGLYDIAQVDLAIPFYVVNMGQFGTVPIQGSALGDISLRSKFRWLSSANEVVGVGGSLDIRLPTGNSEAFVGSPGVAVTPKAIVDTRLDTPAGEVLLAANLGMDIQKSRPVHNVNIGSGFLYGLGAEIALLDDLVTVSTELIGRMHLGDTLFSRAGSPLEGILGAKMATPQGITIMAGLGGGLIGGIGTPKFRTFMGLSYTHPTSLISTIPASPAYDPCPDKPRDYDGPVDDDGCPIPVEEEDETPRCDDPGEDYEGELDEYGCPIPESEDEAVDEGVDDEVEPLDSDGDGIPDHLDKCPHEPGLPQYDGCPPPVQKAVRERDEIKILDKVFFETEKAVILPESYELLDQVGLILRTNPDIRKVEIAGHTDQRGNATYNQMLSEERAKAVRQYLIDRARIAPQRLQSAGYGPSRPLVQGTSDEAMAKNRRVEFRILEQD